MHIHRYRRRFSTGAIFIALVLTTGLGAAGAAFQGGAGSAKAAYEECKTLMGMDLLNRAITRCDDAVRLDPNLADPYLILGNAHDALWQKEMGSDEHRQKAAENYRRFLALTRGESTEALRRGRGTALTAILQIYIFGGDKVGDLDYANELARAPSLGRRELFVLAAAYGRHDRPDLSETFVKRQMAADPKDKEACGILATLYNQPVWNGRTRFDDLVSTLELCASLTPSDPVEYYTLATHLFDKAYRDTTLVNKEKLVYAERGLVNVNKALALDPKYFEAVVYKGLLLRTKASAISDPGLQQKLLNEATELQKQALALKAAGVPLRGGVASGVPPAPPPPPPPPPPSLRMPTEPVAPVVSKPKALGLSEGALRVGGDVKEPTKIKNVPPVYPEIAKQARVQGVIILECTIDKEGRVRDIRVLKGTPLLDQAAVDAVKQWEYEPTRTKEGIAVSVIMTVTVTFALR